MRFWARLSRETHNNASETALGVAVALQLLGHSGEDTGRQCHVEDAVLLLRLTVVLDLLEVLVQADEGIILIILARNIGAHLAELI